MKVWSKGLGTMTIVMDFRKIYLEIENGKLLVKGQITDPVFWNYVITIEKNDIRGLANMFFKPGFLAFGGRHLTLVLKFFYQKLFQRDLFDHPEEKIEIVKES